MANNGEPKPVINVLSEALGALPEVSVGRVEADPHAMDSGANWEITLEVQGHPVCLLIAQKKSAYPRDVREAAWRLASLPLRNGGVTYVPMVVSPALPQNSRDLLREQKLAYADSSGSLYLPLPWALFYVDRPVPRLPRRQAQNIYKGRTNQVLHVLLSEPGRPWHVSELAERAGVSPSTVHQVFTVLENNLWVEGQGRGPERVRFLREPGAVLDAWKEEHALGSYERRSFYGWAQSLASLRETAVAALDTAAAPYALTLASGAEFVAPYATTIERLSILLPQTAPVSEVAKAANLQAVEDGANVTFFLAKHPGPLLLRRRVENLWIASDIQLYLDLWASPARGREQAEHLRRERIGF